MESKKTILMIANSDTAANGFLSFVERFRDRDNIRLVLVCHSRVQIDIAREKGRMIGVRHFVILDFDERERQRDEAFVDRNYQYVKDKLAVSLYKAVFNTGKIVAQNRKGLKRARSIMRDCRPDIILLYADDKSELEKFFIYCAKRQGIKTVIAPICMSDIESVLINPSNGFRQKKKDKLPLTAKIVRHINPRLEREYQDEIVFFSQPFTEIIDRLMGFSVPNPWVQGSLADIVCTAYPEQYDEIVRELGRESVEGRLFLTESVEDGIIIEGYQNRERTKTELSEKYGLKNKTTVIIAFSERIQLWPKENDLYNKGLIVQSVLEYFSEALVSLHPKSDLKENLFLEDYEGCHIVQEPLREIVGAADMLVYADASSVARWAEWLQIQSVTYGSFTMGEKWTKDVVQKFKAKLADVEEAGVEQNSHEPTRGIDFMDFVLDMI